MQRQPRAPTTAEVAQQCAAIGAVQQQRALLRVNELADRCFRECIDDFGLSKHLRSQEEACISACVAKYLVLSTSVGSAFTEVLGSP